MTMPAPIRTMQPQHYTVLILILLGVVTQMQALHGWSEALSIGFVTGTALNVLNTLYALFSVDRPGGRAVVWEEPKREAFRNGQGDPATRGTPTPPPVPPSGLRPGVGPPPPGTS